MCHVQSLENDFYLGIHGSFDRDFTQKKNYCCATSSAMWAIFIMPPPFIFLGSIVALQKYDEEIL